MNISEKPNNEFIKIQPAPETNQAAGASAVVNGDTIDTQGGGFSNKEGDNDFTMTFAEQLEYITSTEFRQNDAGLYSFGDFHELKLDDFADDDFSQIENLDCAKISKEDARFFVNLVYEENLNSLKTEEGNIKIVESQKTMEVSKTLVNLLSKAQNTQKPVRIDFDNNITLVLKISSEGKLNASFFPSDKSAEEYLRNNIPYLKQEMDAKNISYGSLNYFNQRNKNQNKEKNNE